MLQQEKVEQKQINKQTRHHHVTKLQLPNLHQTVLNAFPSINISNNLRQQLISQ